MDKSKIVKFFEILGVVMRICSFTMLSILGKDTNLLLMWIINTLDAVILIFCAVYRKNISYIILNVFWFIIGLIGIYNSF
jgi:hypothetical protein